MSEILMSEILKKAFENGLTLDLKKIEDMNIINVRCKNEDNTSIKSYQYAISNLDLEAGVIPFNRIINKLIKEVV